MGTVIAGSFEYKTQVHKTGNGTPEWLPKPWEALKVDEQPGHVVVGYRRPIALFSGVSKPGKCGTPGCDCGG
jgi:hypothetical protein